MLTKLLHLIVFDPSIFVLDQWKHPSLKSRLMGGEEGVKISYSLTISLEEASGRGIL